jgi:hypothetical protein
MEICSICRFATALDDVQVRGVGGFCVCLRCYARETNTDRPMPRALRRALSALLTESEAR